MDQVYTRIDLNRQLSIPPLPRQSIQSLLNIRSYKGDTAHELTNSNQKVTEQYQNTV